jgi:TonB family protein
MKYNRQSAGKPDAQMTRRYRRIEGLLLLVLFLAVAGPLPAQAQTSPELSTDQAASRMAEAIARSGARTVVVEDFSGTYSGSSPLGTKLADDFSAALAKVARGFQVAERPSPLAPPPANQEIMAVIYGHFWVQGDQLKITLDAFPWKRSDRILNLGFALRAPEELQAQIRAGSPTAVGDFPFANADGYSHSKCLYCPPAPYTPEALQNRTQGEIKLLAVVNPEGRVQEVRVLQGLPDGLTERAIEDILTWRFEPVLGPDGHAATVVMHVEMAFQVKSEPIRN